MPNYLLDKTYRVATPGGIGASRVVVYGPLAGECSLPTTENAPKLLGVTVHAQPTAGRTVAVRKAGIAEVVAAGPIALGAPLMAAGSGGKVKAVSGAAGTRVNVLGFAESVAVQDGDVIEVFLSIHERSL